MAHSNYIIEPSNPGQRWLFHRLGMVEAEAAVIERKANERIESAGSLVRAAVDLALVCGDFMKRHRGLPRLPSEPMLADWRALAEAAHKAQERLETFLAEHGAAHADPSELCALDKFFAWLPRHVAALERIYAEVQEATLAFIADHRLAGLIHEAKARAKTVFGENGNPIIELEIDPETGSQFLWVVVETGLTIDESRHLSDDLETWWSPQGTPIGTSD